MKKIILVILITLLNSTAFAQNSGLKPGLWEYSPISQIIDGRDMSTQMSSARAKMQEAMANMSPAQREQMQTTMGRQGLLSGGVMQICISPAMAAKDKPMADAKGDCESTRVSRSGNKTSFEINCTTKEGTSVGKGESTVSGDTVTTRMDLATTDNRGNRHTMRSEIQMKYLGSDCKGIVPADELAQKARNRAR
jgi:hypothetical protein